MWRWFITLMVVASCGVIFAQETALPIKFDGQIRVRSEADARDFNSDSDVNTFTLLRTRFGALIEPIEDVEAYIQIQDSRAFGLEPSTLSNTSNIDLHQAYFEVRNLWNKPIRLKVGRQELAYGNERIIGPVGFSNVGRVFDGAKLTLGKQGNFDLFSVILNESNTPVSGPATPASTAGRENADNSFFGAYYKHRRNPDYNLDVYGLFELNQNETVPNENDLTRFTLGGYANGKLSQAVNFESELALQVGQRQGQDVRAFMLTGAVGYTFQTKNKPSLQLGYDYLSGMDAGDNDYKAFDTLFATNHKFYGFMDYFINIPVNTSGAGLQDFMIKGKIPFAGKWTLNAHFHNFRTARGNEKDLGNELDLLLNYKYNVAVTFTFGLAFFSPGELMEQSFSGNDLGVWSYSSLLLNF